MKTNKDLSVTAPIGGSIDEAWSWIEKALQAKEEEVVKEVIKLIKEAEECGDQYGMLYEMIKIHFKKGKE